MSSCGAKTIFWLNINDDIDGHRWPNVTMAQPTCATQHVFIDTADTPAQTHQIHWLPCSIEHDGPAPVDKYFVHGTPFCDVAWGFDTTTTTTQTATTQHCVAEHCAALHLACQRARMASRCNQRQMDGKPLVPFQKSRIGTTRGRRPPPTLCPVCWSG